MAKLKSIQEYTEILEKLNPTEEEVLKHEEAEGGQVARDSFVTNNVWRDRHNHHIHIGFATDMYLGREEAQNFIEWLEKQRG